LQIKTKLFCIYFLLVGLHVVVYAIVENFFENILRFIWIYENKPVSLYYQFKQITKWKT